MSGVDERVETVEWISPGERAVYDSYIGIYGDAFPADRFLTDIARERAVRDTSPRLVADYCRRIDALAAAVADAEQRADDAEEALREIERLNSTLGSIGQYATIASAALAAAVVY